MRCTKVITDYWDIQPLVTISFIGYYLMNGWTDLLSGAVHTGSESPQDRLGDIQTYRTTLASAYMLCYLSAV